MQKRLIKQLGFPFISLQKGSDGLHLSKESYLKLHGMEIRDVSEAEKNRAIDKSVKFVLTMPNGVKYYLTTDSMVEIIKTTRHEIMR